MVTLSPFPARMPILRSFSWNAIYIPDYEVWPGAPVRLLDPASAIPDTLLVTGGGSFGPFEWDDRNLRVLKKLRLDQWTRFLDRNTIAMLDKCPSLTSLTWTSTQTFDSPVYELASLRSSTIETLHFAIFVSHLPQLNVAFFEAFQSMQLPVLKHLIIVGRHPADGALITRVRFPALELFGSP